MNTIVSIRARFRKNKRTGCLLWTGSLSRGYGKVSYKGRVTSTHRLMWEHKHGAIPKHLELDHLCRTKPCGNVSHLELVNHQENISRAARPHPGKTSLQTFRLEPILSTSCKAIASALQMTLSEWVRQILRREVKRVTKH